MLGRRRRLYFPEETPEISMSPLIDMVFILLIFFIVTTTFVEETGIPASGSLNGDPGFGRQILLALNSRGQVFSDGREIEAAHLSAFVQNCLRDEALPVVLQVSDEARAEMVVRTLDQARLGGAAVVTLEHEPK